MCAQNRNGKKGLLGKGNDDIVANGYCRNLGAGSIDMVYENEDGALLPALGMPS